MKIGLLGGSFDPIHNGHLITAHSVLEQRNLDKIILMPCNISPLKTEILPTDDFHRFNMVKCAVEDISQFEVSDYEINKGDVSFTIDTLVEFSKLYDDIELIIGYDNLAVFDKWKNPDAIFDLCKVVVMKRSMDNIPNSKNIYFDKAIFVPTPSIDISSTDIRKRIKNELPIDFLVPQKVKEYIYKNGLYK